jgi:hypothetical protein
VLALTAIAPSARAQTGALDEIEAHVVKLYDADVVVDLSRAEGATEGAVVELWRPLVLKHPITGEELTDLFRIGSLRLTQVQGTLSLARPQGKLSRPPEPGDVVILRRPHRPKPTVAVFPEASSPAPATAASAPSTPGASSTPAAPNANTASSPNAPHDEDVEAVLQILAFVRGKGIRARILAYEGYVKQRPNGRFAAVLWEEAQKLRALVALEVESVGEGPALRSFKPPDVAMAGAPLTLVVEIDRASGAVLHTRTPSEVSYASTPMALVGPRYFSVTLPAESTRAPQIDYFIEAVTAGGETVAVIGEPDSPKKLSVVDPPRPEAPPRHDSIASVASEFASWNLHDQNDFMWQTEGFVGLRFTDVGLRAARTGFGVYRGRGGSLAELDSEGLRGRDVGLTYGYFESEYGISHFTGLIGRVLVGLGNQGVTGGFVGFLRLGNDRSTNLLLGGEVLGTIGVRGITELELATFPNVPILIRTEVTNQPAGSTGTGDAPEDTSHEKGDIGARAIAQVGYRFLPSLTVAVRGSYQGRTINHAGPGVGAGVTYTW